MPLDAWETAPAAALSTATAPGPVVTAAVVPPPDLSDIAPTVTLQDVELCAAGSVSASTGPATITEETLQSILAAAADPLIDHAAVHFGHFDPRFPRLTDGEPAVGWVVPTRVETRGGRRVLIGNLTDVPAKLAAVIRAGYRRRSVELAFGATGTGGRKYAASLTGLGLLGVSAPAVKGLADVAARYYSAPVVPEGGSVGSIELDDTPRVAGALPSASVPGGHDGAVPHPTTPAQEGPTVPKTTDERLRQLLGLAADADVTAIQASIAAAETPAPVVTLAPTTPVPPVSVPTAVTTSPAPAAPTTVATVPAAGPAAPAAPVVADAAVPVAVAASGRVGAQATTLASIAS